METSKLWGFLEITFRTALLNKICQVNLVILDLNENWFLVGDAPEDQVDFSSTVTHELGHAIGINIIRWQNTNL